MPADGLVGLLGPMSPWMTGGIAVHVAGLANALADARSVRAVTPGLRGGRHRVGRVEVRVARQFPVTPLPPFDFSPELAASLSFLRGAEVLHAHDPRLCVAAKLLDKPLVTTFHGYLPRETAVNTHTRPGRPLYELLDRLVALAVDWSATCITVDRRIAQWLTSEYGARSVHVIPNAVDAQVYRPDTNGTPFRRAHGISDTRPLLLAAKHFVPKNGMDVLVRAMPIVRRSVPEALLVLAGHGDQEHSLRDLVRDLGLSEGVLFPGQVPHDRMPEALATCDVCVIPSVPVQGVEEATSILALEAMATGKTVVASDIGGLREILRHGGTGLLVPPRDPDALASALIQALQSLELRRSLGAAARAYVVANHSWGPVAHEVSALYEEAIAARN